MRHNFHFNPRCLVFGVYWEPMVMSGRDVRCVFTRYVLFCPTFYVTVDTPIRFQVLDHGP